MGFTRWPALGLDFACGSMVLTIFSASLFALRAKREAQKTGNTMLPQAKLAEMRAIV
jgi:hypothetical protein